MNRIYGYCRISTNMQNIERQVRNILSAYPSAVIVRETFTGTKTTGRKKLEQVINAVKENDIIVFDSVSRMSRNADDGIALYMELYSRGVSLVFLKEPHINTSVYQQAMNNTIAETGNTIADMYIQTTNRVLMLLAEQQIRLAFEQAEKEVSDLHQRTKEGIETARLNGKQIGQQKGRKLNVKKAMITKEIIKKHSKDFGGTLSDPECIKLAEISHNSYYKYKRELFEEGGDF